MLKRRLGREILVVCAYTLALIGCVSIGKRLAPHEIALMGTLLLGLLAFGLVLLTLERRNRRKVLDPRPPLSTGEIYARYYAEDGIPRLDFERAWQEIARTLAADPEKCRPDDSLSSLYALPEWIAPWQWGDPGRLVELIAKRGYGTPAPLETLDDIVRAMTQPTPAQTGEELAEAA